MTTSDWLLIALLALPFWVGFWKWAFIHFNRPNDY